MKPAIALALGAALLLIVAVVGSVMASGIADIGLPPGLWLAYGIGAVLSIIVGGGLFALTFYSARNGYDDIDRPEDSAS
ncbi:MAG: hypothetical protein AAF216_03045 [Pseudomonadota bacterium]